MNSKILDNFARTTDQIYSLEELRSKLALQRPLRIKYGVDVTAPLLHIGHAVNLWMMRELQDAGHVVVFLIGDFTTRVGDPTGKSVTRPVIPPEDIERNAESFLEQVSIVLRTDPAVFEVRRNSEWWANMPLNEFMSYLSMVTHSQLITRDMFQGRMEEGSEIHMHEMIYPILQGYDSVALESDLTIVGTDQLFNELMGRFYQERLGQTPQVVITTKITPGIDGRVKQSKSIGNYISIAHPPREMFGRTMSIPDSLIWDYFDVYTTVPSTQLDTLRADVASGNLNPMIAKRELAKAIVGRYHGDDVAGDEDAWFVRTFSEKSTPDRIPEVDVPAGASLLDVLRLCLPDQSSSALRRLVAGGGVSLEGVKLFDSDYKLIDGGVLKVGRRQWFKLIIHKGPLGQDRPDASSSSASDDPEFH